MIKYTKEIKPYKSKLKEILLRLLNHRVTLAKYKSHIILAVLVSVSSYVLGHTVAYNNDISWVYRNRDSTKKFVLNSKNMSNIQQDLYSNIINAYDQVVECLQFNRQTCDPDVAGKKLKDLAKEKEQMITELNKTNFERTRLLKEMGLE